MNRQVYEIPRGAGASEIQHAINSAGRLCGKRPVVHLPAADYQINKTLVCPANCDIQIDGDGGFSTLRWSGQRSGPALILFWPLKGNSP